MLKIFIILSFIVTLLSLTPKSHANNHYLIYCKILNKEGVVLKSFGGVRCLYLNDGSVVSAGRDFLQMHDSKMNLLWRREIHTHHQLNFSLDKKKLLVMTSSIKKYQGQKVKFDRLSIYNLKGQELKWFDTFENLKQLKSISKLHSSVKLNPVSDRSIKRKGAYKEYMHANSFYEIDNNILSNKYPVFSKGNYLVNSLGYDLTFILDKDLKKIIWHLPIKYIKRNHMYHDVQLLKNGKILIFDNHAGFKPKHSEIKLYDPIADKFKTILKGDPLESFASWECCSGVQILENGNFLTTNHLKDKGGYVVEMTPAGKQVWSFPNPDINKEKNKPHNIQQVRTRNLDEFLKKNIGY